MKQKIKCDEEVISNLRIEIGEIRESEKKMASSAKMEEINVQKFIEAKTRELTTEGENLKRKIKSLIAKNRIFENRNGFIAFY